MGPLVVCRRSLFALAAALSLVTAPAGQAAAGESQKVLAVSRSLVRDAADYSFRRWLRRRVLKAADEARYGLRFDRDWADAAARSPARPLVVLVHGFNSTPERNAAILVPIRKAGFPCAAFAYPNDWELAESAAILSRQLKRLHDQHPNVSVALVTHSMGGIVARVCLERGDLDPGNVTRLIMIAPPSQGTLLAHLAVATDLWEHWLNRPTGSCWTRWRDSVIDGLGEAADDLAPGSPFLTRLNQGPRNLQVSYSILLGASAAVSEGEMQWIRSAVDTTGGRCPALRTCAAHVDDLLGDMDEIIDGKGDGVVAVKRGRLAGVDDTIVLPFGHLSCTGPPDCEAVRQLQEAVLSRLQ
ncbi:MAG: hypothetical protein IT424_04665 [Pirellulales bacterium]|nr:hypothetical protein [Pirellulales bacterium]